MTGKKAFSPLSGIQRILEVGLISCHGIAIFIMLSLLTFYPSDPSWTQTAWDGPVKNSAGASGAWLADVLLFVFGIAAYLLPLVIVGVGWAVFWRPKALLQLDYLTLGLRIIGFLFVALGAMALASLNFNDIYYFSSGGIVGDVLSESMVGYFGMLGSTLILLCFIATGITMLTGLSWLTIVDKLGAGVIDGFQWLTKIPEHIDVYKEKRRQSREHQGADKILFADKLPERQREEPQAVNLPDLEQILPDLDVKASPAAAKTKTAKHEYLDESTDVTFDPIEEVAVFTKPQPQKVAQQKMPTPPKAHLQEVGNTATSPLTQLPSVDLLDRPNKIANPITQEELDQVSRLVEAKLLDFNIQANVVAVFPGPVITRFELDLAPGVKVSKITSLSKDLARSLSALSVRVVEVIAGKSVIGLELPNKHRETVFLREVLDCEKFTQNGAPLSMVLGADIAGNPVVVDLAKMPHLLVAGTTGSGKSVGVNCMIVSLLYKSSPEDVRMIMIDPKMLELSVYEGIPHLLSEVVTDMKEAANALRWCVGEMERRYKVMSAVGVRNLKGYNTKIETAIASGNPICDPLWKPGDSMDETAPQLETLPHIVVIVDEFADMMMIVGKKVEELIARIAQKARAAGIHLILATQRPSVDVITGLIKANIPTRIAFQVSSKIDSRTILDQQGAETLLGMGDMLYLPPGTGVPTRVHGAFVDDHEVHKVVADWKLRGKPNYVDEILNGDTTADNLLPGEAPEGEEDYDPLFDDAVAFVTETRRGSVSGVQRKFKIGYNRAARIVEQMELNGVVSAPGHNGNREVLAPPPPKD